MRNIFLLFLIFFVTILKSQDDVYYVVTDTIVRNKIKILKHVPNYRPTNNVNSHMYRDFYYISRRNLYSNRFIDIIPYDLYYYDDMLYNPIRNNNTLNDIPSNVNFRPRTTGNKPKIEKTPTNPKTGGRNF